MIVNFLDRVSNDIYDGKNNKNTQKRLPPHMHASAKRKLDMLNAACVLNDLKALPGNKLEKLEGIRGHQHSIRINDQYRIVFTWIDGNAEDVEVIDYH